METPREITDLIEAGALFVCNHSGGKDSQAMYAKLRALVPASQLICIHASLGDVEWQGTIDHIQATIDSPLIVCEAVSDWWQMVERRQMFPDPQRRQCTSDLKRTPIEREVRRYLAMAIAEGDELLGHISKRGARHDEAHTGALGLRRK